MREKLKEAVKIAAELTDSDPDSSNQPYALVAIGIISFLSFWAFAGIYGYVLLKRRLGAFYSSVSKEEPAAPSRVNNVVQPTLSSSFSDSPVVLSPPLPPPGTAVEEEDVEL